VAPNRLARDFQADAPHMKWVTDVTEFRIADQKMYLSPVLDLFNGEIIAHAVRPSPALPLVMDMLTDAFKVLKPGEHPVLHSDQGWQYQHRSWVSALQDRGLHQSMSRKANCYDNAAMESFFGHLKEGRDSANTSIGTTTPASGKKLKGLSPVQYRTQSLAVA